MRYLFSHLLAWTMTLALMAGGTGWAPCANAHVVKMDTANVMQMSMHEGHHAHGSTIQHSQDAAHAGRSKMPLDDHNCQKCCGICSLTNMPPQHSADFIRLSFSRVSFAFADDILSDWRAMLEPEIPKA